MGADEVLVRRINLPQVEGSEVDHDSVYPTAVIFGSARSNPDRMATRGWEGEKAARPQSKEVTQAAEGDQQIVGPFRCCSPISHCLCRKGGGGKCHLAVLLDHAR